MSKRAAKAMILNALLFVAACQTAPVPFEAPAVISNSTPEGHAELLRVMTEIFNGTAVTLADDALTTTSVLVVEPAQLGGRDLRQPEQFRLLISGTSCVLVRESDGTRWKLSDTQCEPR